MLVVSCKSWIRSFKSGISCSLHSLKDFVKRSISSLQVIKLLCILNNLNEKIQLIIIGITAKNKIGLNNAKKDIITVVITSIMPKSKKIIRNLHKIFSGIKKVCLASKAHPEMHSTCCHTAFPYTENRSTNSHNCTLCKQKKNIQLCDENSVAQSFLFVNIFQAIVFFEWVKIAVFKPFL